MIGESSYIGIIVGERQGSLAGSRLWSVLLSGGILSFFDLSQVKALALLEAVDCCDTLQGYPF